MLVDDPPLALLLARHVRHSSLADDRRPFCVQTLYSLQVHDVSEVRACDISEDLEARVSTVAILRGSPIKTRRDLSASADDSAKCAEDRAVASARPAALVRPGVPADESTGGRADLIMERRPGGHGRSVAHSAAGVNRPSASAARNLFGSLVQTSSLPA